MDAILVNVNWLAVIVGAVVAFGLSMVWFGPLFGKVWAQGSHGITPPARFPVAAMVLYAVGTFLLAWLIGATATINALGTAIGLVLALAIMLVSSSLLGQKSTAAALIDGGIVILMGVVMIVAQGVF